MKELKIYIADVGDFNTFKESAGVKVEVAYGQIPIILDEQQLASLLQYLAGVLRTPNGWTVNYNQSVNVDPAKK